MDNITKLKVGDTVLVKCKVEAVFANSQMVMVTTRDCDQGFDAYIDEIVCVGEEKIVENNCTTVHREDEEEWYQEVLRCTSCERLFMLDEFKEGIIGCYCPYCGKKIVNYKEDEE